MTLKAVLLDYGHTLVDIARPESHLLDAYHRINLRLEKELEREIPAAADLVQHVSIAVDDAIGKSYMSGAEQEVDIAELYDQALRAIGFHLEPETVRWVMTEEQNAWYHGIFPSPDLKKVLRALKKRGLRVVIVSNFAFPAEAGRGQLRHLGVADYFDATVYSSECGVRKPGRAIYEEALKLAGVDAAEALFVGDRLREDVRGPGALGIDAVLTHEFRQEAPEPGMTMPVIKSLAELVSVIESRTA